MSTAQGNHEHLDTNHSSDDALTKIKTAGSISISPELFEKIYLTPQNKIKGELRGTFANPTPLALVGFLLALTPLCCDLMDFRGAQLGNGSASIGAYLGFGGILMILGGVGEFIVGNTFPMCVFASFGAFWLTFGFTLIPFYHASGNYAAGTDSPTFNNAFGFFLLWMAILCLVYMVCAIRTNIVFLLIFFLLAPAFACLCAAFWYLALGLGTGSAADAAKVSPLLKAGGALAFAVCLLGWYIFTAILFASLDFPIQLPVGDLSTIVKGGSEKV